MKNKKKIPKASMALVLAAFLLLAVGGGIATFAEPDVISEDYKAEFELDHLGIALVENDEVLEDQGDAHENLIEDFDGKVELGRVYREELAVKNTTDDVDEYIRMYVRVYWLDPDGNKDASVDPSLIELTYNGKEYNDSAWQINPKETTEERRVFYYNKLHKAGEVTEPVVNKLSLDGKAIEGEYTETEKTVGNKKIYVYTYKYDGYSIAVEADCQSLQSHNVNDAIKSVWGVDNVRVSGGNLIVE